MELLDKIEKLGLKISRDPMRGYLITSSLGTSMLITDALLLSIGTMQRKWHHTEDCWTNYADYVPFPPSCDCPVEELGPITEEGIISIVYQKFRDELQSLHRTPKRNENGL